MRIYLWDKVEWKLFDSEDKDFKKELEVRKIIISDSAKIGNSVEIGDSAEIGYSVEIGNYAEIGYYAKIGDSAEIGDSAKIGNYAKITKDNIFSDYSLFYHLGIVAHKDTTIVYKAVREDLTAYHNGYQYKIGKGDKKKLEPNQSIDCGDGWHFTNLEGAVKWLKEKGEGKIISAEINPKDILHISWKVRVRAFKNVQVVNVDYLL